METVRFRPLFGRVLAVIVCVMALLGIAGFFITGDLGGAARYAWPILLVGVLAWALYLRPELVIEEHGVTVVNVFRTYFVPWPAIQHIETRFAVMLHTTDGKVSVWASPAPGRHGATRVTRSDFTGISGSAYGKAGSLRPGDALSTESGAAAHILRLHWEKLRDAGMFEHGVEPGSVRVTWHTATIAAMIALLVASLVGLLL
jgi:hypothetical protein